MTVMSDAGGLSFAWGIDGVAMIVIQLLAAAAFAVTCIFTTQKTQLMVGPAPSPHRKHN